MTWTCSWNMKYCTHFGKCSRSFKYSMQICTAGIIIINCYILYIMNINKYKAARIKWVWPPPCLCVCVCVSDFSQSWRLFRITFSLSVGDGFIFLCLGRFSLQMEVGRGETAGLGLYTDLCHRDVLTHECGCQGVAIQFLRSSVHRLVVVRVFLTGPH